jgi:hypothetical protein
MSAAAGRQLDERINLALMLASAVAAVRWPIETFLLAYAVLGPLHYVTEISWLHDRAYFLPGRRDAWPIMLVGAAIIVGGGFTRWLYSSKAFSTVALAALMWSFSLSAVLVWVRAPRWRCAMGAALALGCWGASAKPGPVIAVAAFLPTLLHVSVFTGLFMLGGYFKGARSMSAALAIAAFVCLPVACWWIPLSWSSVPGAWASAAFAGSVGSVKDQVLEALGHFAPHAATTGSVSRQVARCLAFAYLYHYLNWFAKTRVIGWTQMSQRRAIALTGIWVVSVCLYWTNYVLGFAVVATLSYLHVLLEFPLNHTVLKQILGVSARRVFARLQTNGQ